jgi:hypothetical protein
MQLYTSITAFRNCATLLRVQINDLAARCFHNATLVRRCVVRQTTAISDTHCCTFRFVGELDRFNTLKTSEISEILSQKFDRKLNIAKKIENTKNVASRNRKFRAMVAIPKSVRILTQHITLLH